MTNLDDVYLKLLGRNEENFVLFHAFVVHSADVALSDSPLLWSLNGVRLVAIEECRGFLIFHAEMFYSNEITVLLERQ